MSDEPLGVFKEMIESQHAWGTEAKAKNGRS